MDESFTSGGFTASQAGAGPSAPQSKEGVAPLTVGQVLQLGDDGIKIFGFTYGVVSLVAIVRQIEPTSTRTLYKLEDHTGTIDSYLWEDENNKAEKLHIPLNKYVRAYGMAKTVNGVKVLTLFKIMPTKNVNEFTTHMLEMMQARFQGEKYQRMMESGADANDSKNMMDVDVSDSNGSGLKGKHLLVYQAIKNHGTEEGISNQQLHQKFKHIPLQEIRQITEAMSLEGHIYSSVDPDHFLPTE
ncbi:replication protein A 32 kDa subunit [Sergentomyia squamirostris]